jgi:hypothetical protein
MDKKIKLVDTNLIKTDSRYLSRFKYKVFRTMIEDMRKNGYDDATPIICREQVEKDGHKSLILIDGDTRLSAAKKAGLKKVLVTVYDFLSDRRWTHLIRQL